MLRNILISDITTFALKGGVFNPYESSYKNRLIDLIVSNLANAVLHKILEQAIDNADIASKYLKEINNSWDVAKRYREKVNPLDRPLPEKERDEIKEKIIRKVKAELQIRIAHGYGNLDLGSVEKTVEEMLKKITKLACSGLSAG